MIRSLFLMCMFLNSCSGIPVQFYEEFFASTKSIFVSSNLDSSKVFYDNSKYSYATISIGSSPQSVIVLSSVDDDIYEWVSEDGVLIYTHQGKIIRTIGLLYDSTFFGSTPIWTDGFVNNIQLDLYNPDALSLMGRQYITYSGTELTDYLGKPSVTEKYIETTVIDAIKWKAVNEYSLSKNGLVIRTSQKIHPYLPKIELQYFLK